MTDEQNLEFLKFFDPTTMSIHLKENQKPLGKKGKPGNFELVEVGEKTLDRDYLEVIVSQILNSIDDETLGNTEISKPGALVIQYRDYRIAITRPPFSELLEITIVHPIKQMELEDYKISEKLMSRLAKQAEGILISGAPGSGKSTLASGIANFYNRTGKIVKTFESPRDLQVDHGVTQYTRLDGSFENSADVLLLVRPDYTIFDEVRRREDFRIFSDLRLTGVGMVGVVHANTPLDAIQRFIGKIELGIIPSILDTVVFVKDGEITKVYELEFKVKVPSGMMEQDLARPVIDICDFESDELEYEIYTFGEENVIMPVSKKNKKHGIELLAEKKIIDVIRRFDPNPSVEFLSESSIRVFVSKESIPSIIGRNGNTIKELENELNLHIDVEANYNQEVSNHGLSFDFSESRTALLLDVGREYSGTIAEIFVNNEFLISSKINRKGNIKILKRSSDGKLFSKVVSSKNDIQVFLKTH
jgi:ATPase|tara:strand:+ start:247 stop:1671 length:1425 start_codon:yes stop_codon:yes gene_type:complete